MTTDKPSWAERPWDTDPSTAQPEKGQEPPPRAGEKRSLGCFWNTIIITIVVSVIIIVVIEIVDSFQSSTSSTGTSTIATSSPVPQNTTKSIPDGDFKQKYGPFTSSELFGSQIVEILNAYDLGDHATQLNICRDVSSTLSGMATQEMDDRMNQMKDYDYSILMDLINDCNRLID